MSDTPAPLDRRAFLARLGLGTAAAAALLMGPGAARAASPATRASGMASGEFVFARLRYDSGDWEYNPKVAANVLDAVVQYTHIPVYPHEVVITADSDELPAFPFLFMTGHTLVRFSEAERAGLRRYVEGGGFLFSDDCNHDIEGLYARSFEAEMARVFPPAEPGGDPVPKIPGSHPLYTSFFDFSAGPPQTSHELNGWGDNMVHEYLRAVERRGRIGVLYSNKDYGCEWDYDWRNKRFRAEDNTRFAVNIVVYAMT
jgi:hypothetical protein